MARRGKISTTMASRSRLEQATVAYFEILPADAAPEELKIATGVDVCTNEIDLWDAPWEADLPTP